MALTAVLVITAVRGQNSKLSPDLAALLPQDTKRINVIIQYVDAPTATDLTDLVGNGGSLNRQYVNLPNAAISIPVGRLNALANSKRVQHISLDRPIGGTLDYTAATVGADLAWRAGLDGTGVGVAVIDSGIADHVDLKTSVSGSSRVVYQENFIDQATGDSYGHGTHVA